MDFPKELLEKAKSVKGVEELLAFAEKNNIKITKEDAAKVLATVSASSVVQKNEKLSKAVEGLSGLLNKD